MYASDKGALLCDLAETYGIFDMRALPVNTLATLACGLSEDSRIKRKLTGAKLPSDIMLLAAAVDRLSMLFWAQTEDGQKNRNRPKLILSAALEEKENEVETFDSPEAFLAARAHAIGD